MTASRTGPADRAALRLLALLVALTATVTVTAATALGVLLPVYRTQMADHCTLLVGWLASHPEAVLGLLPFGLVATVVCCCAWRALQQRAATSRLLVALGRPRDLPGHLQQKVLPLGLEGRVDCVAHPVPLIFCHGMYQPRICISDSLLELLDDDELTAVLLHERHHVKRHDPARLLLTRVLSAGIGFIPGVAAVVEGYVTATEMAADAAASAGADGRLALAEAMLKLARAQYSMRELSLAPVSPFSSLLVRVDTLLSPNSETPRLDGRTFGRIAIGLGVMILIATAPVALVAKSESPALHPCETELHHHLN